MAFVQFVSESYLKTTTVIDDNVDMKLLNPTLRLVQEKFILPILGTALYNKLVTEVTAGTLASYYKTLMDDYILPTMSWYIMCESPIPLGYRFMNKGVMRKSSENSQPADVYDIHMNMDKAKDNAEYYALRLYKYLNANTSHFTEYTSPGTASDTVFPNTRIFSSSIFLGDSGMQKSALTYKKDEGLDGQGQ